MHIYESDLRSFKSDFLLASNAEITADGYLRQLRKLAEYTTDAMTIRVARLPEGERLARGGDPGVDHVDPQGR